MAGRAPDVDTEGGERVKVWITKYAMTSGVFTAEAERAGNMGCIVRSVKRSRFTGWFQGNDWHTDEAKAIERFNQMKQKKIASLKKQLAKVEALEFLARGEEP